MATYTNISAADMDKFLRDRGYTPLQLEGVNERVYGRVFKIRNTTGTLRIYTGVEGESSRAMGKDAIRCTLFIKDEHGNIYPIGSTKRVNRVAGWEKNLQSRLEQVEDMLGPWCPKCNGFMIKRSGKYGEFWGCATWGHTKCSGILRTADCKPAKVKKTRQRSY